MRVLSTSAKSSARRASEQDWLLATNRPLFKDYAAESDLIGIWLYTYEKWDERQADEYLDAIESGVVDLAKAPEKGRTCESYRSGYWSRDILRHLAFYTFNHVEVRLRRVLHRAMDPSIHLPGH